MNPIPQPPISQSISFHFSSSWSVKVNIDRYCSTLWKILKANLGFSCINWVVKNWRTLLLQIKWKYELLSHLLLKNSVEWLLPNWWFMKTLGLVMIWKYATGQLLYIYGTYQGTVNTGYYNFFPVNEVLINSSNISFSE